MPSWGTYNSWDFREGRMENRLKISWPVQPIYLQICSCDFLFKCSTPKVAQGCNRWKKRSAKDDPWMECSIIFLRFGLLYMTSTIQPYRFGGTKKGKNNIDRLFVRCSSLYIDPFYIMRQPRCSDFISLENDQRWAAYTSLSFHAVIFLYSFLWLEHQSSNPIVCIYIWRDTYSQPSLRSMLKELKKDKGNPRKNAPKKPPQKPKAKDKAKPKPKTKRGAEPAEDVPAVVAPKTRRGKKRTKKDQWLVMIQSCKISCCRFPLYMICSSISWFDRTYPHSLLYQKDLPGANKHYLFCFYEWFAADYLELLGPMHV